MKTYAIRRIGILSGESEQPIETAGDRLRPIALEAHDSTPDPTELLQFRPSGSEPRDEKNRSNGKAEI